MTIRSNWQNSLSTAKSRTITNLCVVADLRSSGAAWSEVKRRNGSALRLYFLICLSDCQKSQTAVGLGSTLSLWCTLNQWTGLKCHPEVHMFLPEQKCFHWWHIRLSPSPLSAGVIHKRTVSFSRSECNTQTTECEGSTFVASFFKVQQRSICLDIVWVYNKYIIHSFKRVFHQFCFSF